MTAVAIAALAVALAAVAAAGYFGRAALLRSDGQLAAVIAVSAALKAQRDAEDMARDSAAATKAAELGERQAIRMLEAAQVRAKSAEEVLRAHVRSTTLGGSDDDVAHLVEQLLAQPLDTVHLAEHSAAARGGDGTDTAPMRPATATRPGSDFLDAVFRTGER